MSEAVAVTPREDRSLFSLHPEEEMTEHAFHDRQCGYLTHAFGQVLPDWFVARNMAVYWVPEQRQHPYAGPDVFVARGHPIDENPSCYLTFEDGPLTLVVEVVSESTRALEGTRRDETYAIQLAVPEHLLIDYERHALVLSRLVGSRYEEVAPDETGVLWSHEFGVGFVWQEDGRLVRVLTSDGELVPTAQEEAALRREAERRAEQEAQRARQATRLAEEETRRAEEATRLAQEEARRADEEAQRRAEAEARAEALAAELEQMRRAIAEGRGGPSTP